MAKYFPKATSAIGRYWVPAAIVGNIGIFLCLALAMTVTLFGRQFLPLDYEGKITLGAAAFSAFL